MKQRMVAAMVLAAALVPQAAMATEAGGEDRGSWLLLIFYAVNFALFAILIVYYAAPPARKFFADRAGAIRSGLSRADRAFSEAQELANRAAAKMAALEAEIKALATELEEETAFQMRSISGAAKTAAERVGREAELGAAAMAENAVRRVRERLADSATGIARELIAREFHGDDQARLINGFTSRLGAEGRR
ncbi:MAG: hypothetical protein ACREQI_05300 [Candidatus Binataceae bacterium]